jgi:hypothetical protein
VATEEARLWNTAPARRYSRPDRSSATTVFSNDGGSGDPTTAATSARCSAIPASSASRQCSRVTSAKGGSCSGSVEGSSSGLSADGAVEAGTEPIHHRPSRHLVEVRS